MRRPVTVAQKREAVALARVIGSEGAAGQLGWDRRSIVKWMAQAGDPPELVGEPEVWQRLHDLATAKAEALLASGKLRPVEVISYAGIAARNLRARPATPDQPDPDADPTPLTTAALARWQAWLDSLPQTEHRAVTRTIRDELDRRADARRAAEERGEYEPPEPPEPLTDADGAAMWDGILVWSRANLPDLIVQAAAADALDAARLAQREKANRWLTNDEADLLIEADKYLEDIA